MKCHYRSNKIFLFIAFVRNLFLLFNSVAQLSMKLLLKHWALTEEWLIIECMCSSGKWQTNHIFEHKNATISLMICCWVKYQCQKMLLPRWTVFGSDFHLSGHGFVCASLSISIGWLVLARIVIATRRPLTRSVQVKI